MRDSISIPAYILILNNSETWVDISEESIKQLEDIQYMFLRLVFDVPLSTPKSALVWESGCYPMEIRIAKRKLNFLNFVKRSGDENLSKQVYSEQVKNNWPGPVKEGDNICEQLNIPKISSNDIYKDEIEDACKKKAENDIKEKI